MPKTNAKPRTIDYQILTEQGLFDSGSDYFRVTVVESGSGKRVHSFNEERIQNGFGSNPKEAIDDFIRRNKSDVLDMVFDL